ncbi:hypothetical protein HDU96_005619 [Phlyctochytrium bullatum]|nr:hypothetical protein HDU96_005619 [Phlyctochytrium bullatum]
MNAPEPLGKEYLNHMEYIHRPAVDEVTMDVVGLEARRKRVAAHAFGKDLTNAELGRVACREIEAIFKGLGPQPWMGPSHQDLANLTNAITNLTAEIAASNERVTSVKEELEAQREFISAVEKKVNALDERTVALENTCHAP